MRKVLGWCALVAVALSPAACSLKIFEDVGSDPHPPTVEIIELVRFVAEETPAAQATAAATDAGGARAGGGRIVSTASPGFTLTRGQKFQLHRAYSDAGGDIERFTVRDRDGSLKTDLTPTGQTFYTGTVGTILGPKDGLELTGVIGVHRLELWAEDSHGSRSEKVEFVITLEP